MQTVAAAAAWHLKQQQAKTRANDGLIALILPRLLPGPARPLVRPPSLVKLHLGQACSCTASEVAAYAGTAPTAQERAAIKDRYPAAAF